LMDIQMPEMGGHAATRRIRMDERYAQLPVVAMTAHATAEEREECLRSGMQDHITKPINPEHFYQTLTRWLTRARAELSAASKPPAKDPQPIEVPGFDTADTMDRLAGDVELYHRVLEMYLPSLATALEQFGNAVASCDQAGTKSVVHSIRGMSANVGAVTLADHAAELEAALGRHQEQPEQLASFRELIEETLRVVEQALAARKAA